MWKSVAELLKRASFTPIGSLRMIEQSEKTVAIARQINIEKFFKLLIKNDKGNNLAKERSKKSNDIGNIESCKERRTKTRRQATLPMEETFADSYIQEKRDQLKCEIEE